MQLESTTKDLLRQAADTVEMTPRSGRALVATAHRARRRRRLVAFGAATVTAVVVVGVAVAGGPSTTRTPSPQPVASPSPSASPSGQAGRRVDVPVLVEHTEQEATQRLQQWGLVVVVEHREEPCLPAGAVVEQDPRAGSEVAAGSSVTIVVAARRPAVVDCPDGVAFDHDRKVARQLWDFSRGVAGATVPWAPRVTVALLEDTVRTTLTEQQANVRDRWRLPVSTAGTSNPDLLQHLAESGGRYRVDIGPHPYCVGPTPPTARGAEGLRQVSITPTGPRATCRGWWALDVYLNDAGQIQRVSLHEWKR